MVTNYRGMYVLKQSMQWPVWPREIVIKASGMIDRKNNGCLVVLKSVDEGQKYFDVPCP